MRQPQQSSVPLSLSQAQRLAGSAATALVLFAIAMLAAPIDVTAQEMQHLSVTQPGGMPGWPTVTGVQPESNGVTVTWDGPAGYYRVYQGSTPNGSDWQVVSTPALGRAVTVATNGNAAFFRVSGPPPHYAGARACMECHGDIHQSEMDTRHARALETLKQIGQDKNPACLACHTVGYGLPTGFISESATPHLAGVQCENCHGPAGRHAANDSDFAARPRAELASTVCGGCHTDAHHPTYDEWRQTGHSVVVEDMNPAGRINSCGRCHSGSVRLSLLKNEALPAGDANLGVECVVCHDPHRNTGNPAQLRNPTISTNDYFLASADTFTDKYDANVNVCGQCHNHRGATFDSNARPPHHSPQYNIMLGTVGELADGQKPYQPGGHALRVQGQCVGCHMQSKPFESEEHAAITGHHFKVEAYDSCLSCHPFPELLTVFTTTAVSNRIQQVKSALDHWAMTKAPEALRTKYGARAWEYTTPGTLSSGGAGPSASEQNLIPENIRKARFNLYIVYYDGSFGVHNGPHAVTLLETARTWIQTELNQ